MALQDDREKVAHLLRRFGLGASETELAYYGEGGYASAVDKLVDYEDTDEGFDIDPTIFANQQNGIVSMRGMQYWWYLRLLTTKHPLEQKLTLFWHDHFATSAAKVTVAEAMFRHIETLRTNATGRFDDLLTGISKDPAMLYWLDNNQNVKGTPNENFAREVMELFTLGVDNGYEEEDILEGARALTGWVYGVRRAGRTIPTALPGRSSRFLFVSDRHDDGEKTFLGETGNLDGDDVLQILLEMPATSEYIVKKMWEWFVYRDPAETLVKKLAKDWRESGLDIKALVRDIATHDEFHSDEAVRTHIKNPVEFTIATIRSLGIGEKLAGQIRELDVDKARGLANPVAYVHRASKAMGMELMFPPDVDGWVSGEQWISTATVVERIKFADVLFTGQGRRWLALVADQLPKPGDVPEALVDRLLAMFDVPMPQAKVEILYGSARKTSGGTITQRNLQPTMRSVSRLIFGTPEFQFS